MAVKLAEFANIRVMAILIFLTDVVVLAVVLGILWNMAGVKEETCAKLCLPCADNEMKTCCECHVPTLQRFLTEVHLYVYVAENAKIFIQSKLAVITVNEQY